jgi:hypothetical protein
MKEKSILLGLFLLVLAACSDEVKVENMIGFYPMNIGATWNYEKTIYYTTYDSIGKFKQLSHTIEPLTTVIKKDTVINGIVVRQFVTTIMAMSGAISEAIYYRQDNEGLKEYGFSNYGGSWSELGIIDSVSQSKKQYIIPRFKAKVNFADNVVMYSHPLLLLAYPLSVNSEWYSYSIVSGNLIRVVENDTLQIDGKAYPCFKIETTDPTEYEYYYEWISNAGLLKIECQSVMRAIDPNDISYGQTKEHSVMIAKSILRLQTN